MTAQSVIEKGDKGSQHKYTTFQFRLMQQYYFHKVAIAKYMMCGAPDFNSFQQFPCEAKYSVSPVKENKIIILAVE